MPERTSPRLRSRSAQSPACGRSAASEPTVGDKKNDDDDPDKNITTEDPNKDTSKPGDDTKAPSGDTSAETDAPSEDKKGCQSGISVVPFAAVLVLSAAAVMIGKKRKQD